MGNFTINHYSRLTVNTSDLRVRYVLDMAELPTLTERQDMDKNDDRDVSDSELKAYIHDRTPKWLAKLSASVDDTQVVWTLHNAVVKFTPGVANLATMRIEIDATAPLAPGAHRIAYHDLNYPDRPGWKEMVVAAGPGVEKPAGEFPDKELSRELRSYPNDLISNPPQVSGADFTVDIPAPKPIPVQTTSKVAVKPKALKLAGESSPPHVPELTLFSVLGLDNLRPARVATKPVPPLAAKMRSTVPAPLPRPVPVSPVVVPSPSPEPPSVVPGVPVSRWSRIFHSLVAVKTITPTVLLVSLLIAFGLGALHALQPGHGKTLVAAYLVGQRGTARHAVLLGITVTISHTFGVFLLGAVALYASNYILPQVLAPWMGFFSGVLVAIIGGTMLVGRLRELRRERAHSHAHSMGLDHEHHHHPVHVHSHDHEHEHDHSHRLAHSHGPFGEHTHEIPETISLRSLIALGVSGGIVPCWDALIVLVGAVAIHQTLYGMGLIIAFSAGLATTLTAAGLFVVWGQKATGLSRLTPERIRLVSIMGNMVVLMIGCYLAVQSLVSGGIVGKRY